MTLLVGGARGGTGGVILNKAMRRLDPIPPPTIDFLRLQTLGGLRASVPLWSGASVNARVREIEVDFAGVRVARWDRWRGGDGTR